MIGRKQIVILSCFVMMGLAGLCGCVSPSSDSTESIETEAKNGTKADSLGNLKYESSVIVMIRVRNDKNWLHYVSVVGFDDRYVFVAESLLELVNCNCKYYNRRIEKKFFLQLWNTAMLKQPLFRNTFYVVTKYNTKKGE